MNHVGSIVLLAGAPGCPTGRNTGQHLVKLAAAQAGPYGIGRLTTAPFQSNSATESQEYQCQCLSYQCKNQQRPNDSPGKDANSSSERTELASIHLCLKKDGLYGQMQDGCHGQMHLSGPRERASVRVSSSRVRAFICGWRH